MAASSPGGGRLGRKAKKAGGKGSCLGCVREIIKLLNNACYPEHLLTLIQGSGFKPKNWPLKQGGGGGGSMDGFFEGIIKYKIFIVMSSCHLTSRLKNLPNYKIKWY